MYFARTALHASRRKIHDEVADLEPLTDRLRLAARDRAQPRFELAKDERLAEVVIGTGIEAGDAIVDRVLRRQHEYRGLDALRSEIASDAEAVARRQHDVEHDGIVLAFPRDRAARLTVHLDVDDVAALDESATDDFGETDVVLDDEHFHIIISPTRTRSRSPRP